MRATTRRAQWMGVSVGALMAMAAVPAIAVVNKGAAGPCLCSATLHLGRLIGVNVGGGWGQGTVTNNATGGTFGTGERGSFAGGGQPGYNYQVGNVVLGIEGFFDGIATVNNNTGDIVTGLDSGCRESFCVRKRRA